MKYNKEEQVTSGAMYAVFPAYNIGWPIAPTTHDTILDFLIARGVFDLEPADALRVTSRELSLHFPSIDILPVRTTIRVTEPIQIMSPEEVKRLRAAKIEKDKQFAQAEREARKYPHGKSPLNL